MIYVDANEQILGRMAAKVAKLALEGNQIAIVNSEKAVITGTQSAILARYRFLREDLGSSPFKGPFFPKRADRIVKRTIKGMLPHKMERGRKALKRVKCYVKVPVELADKQFESWEGSSVGKLDTAGVMKVGKLAELLGAKHVE